MTRALYHPTVDPATLTPARQRRPSSGAAAPADCASGTGRRTRGPMCSAPAARVDPASALASWVSGSPVRHARIDGRAKLCGRRRRGSDRLCRSRTTRRSLLANREIGTSPILAAPAVISCSTQRPCLRLNDQGSPRARTGSSASASGHSRARSVLPAALRVRHAVASLVALHGRWCTR